MERRLDRLALFEEVAAELVPWPERREYELGAALVEAGETQTEMQLMVAGAASVKEYGRAACG